eukprot:11484957-Alexandrium_andersonii.AAC.1
MPSGARLMTRFSSFTSCKSSASPPRRPIDFAHELLVREVSDDVVVHIVAGEGEVVHGHDAPDIKLGIVKAARACFPPDEPEDVPPAGQELPWCRKGSGTARRTRQAERLQ